MAGFATGLIHPLQMPLHILCLAGIALLAGRASVPHRGAIILALTTGLIGGLGAVASGVGETAAGDVLALVALICGLAAAKAARLLGWLAAPLALVAGLAIGLDSPPETISLREAVWTLFGTAAGSILAAAALREAAAWAAVRWRGIALRVAGSWIAAIGILVLALRLAG
jgi:urease accessory protein